MVAPKDYFHPGKFTLVDELIVLDIQDNKNTNKWQTKEITPPGGGTVGVAWRDSWLAVRIRDSDEDIQEVLMYPAWMVVSISSVV